MLKEKTIEEIKSEIERDLKSQYHDLNPFPDGETTVTVTVEIRETCEPKKISLSNTNEQPGVSCDPNDYQRRKRRGFFGDLVDEAKDTASSVAETASNAAQESIDTVEDTAQSAYEVSETVVVDSYTAFKDSGETAVNWSAKQAKNLADNVQKKAVEFANIAKNAINKSTKWMGNLMTNAICELESSGAFGSSLGFLTNPQSLIPSNPLAELSKIVKYRFSLKNWMSSLPANMRKLPLTMLAIPGSHDSFTYKMRTDMSVSLDSDLAKNRYSRSLLNFFGEQTKALRNLIAAWGKCIKQTTFEQLQLGLRYFDIRSEFEHEKSISY